MEKDGVINILYCVKVDPDNGSIRFMNSEDPKNQDKIIRWDMKLTNRDIHTPTDGNSLRST